MQILAMILYSLFTPLSIFSQSLFFPLSMICLEDLNFFNNGKYLTSSLPCIKNKTFIKQSYSVNFLSQMTPQLVNMEIVFQSSFSIPHLSHKLKITFSSLVPFFIFPIWAPIPFSRLFPPEPTLYQLPHAFSLESFKFWLTWSINLCEVFKIILSQTYYYITTLYLVLKYQHFTYYAVAFYDIYKDLFFDSMIILDFLGKTHTQKKNMYGINLICLFF